MLRKIVHISIRDFPQCYNNIIERTMATSGEFINNLLL
jgi:hypothetical protein